jgi:hypothetical protein
MKQFTQSHSLIVTPASERDRKNMVGSDGTVWLVPDQPDA